MKNNSFKRRQPVGYSDSIIKEKPQTRNKWHWKGKKEVERQGKHLFLFFQLISKAGGREEERKII